MLNVYLYVNAAIYVVFAVWCTIAPASTARNLGYESLSSSGMSEYLVVYGGLQLGLGLFFAYCAQSGAQRAGLVLALALYVPIVLYRCVSVARQWPVASTTLIVGTLEFALLVCALLLYWKQRT